MLLSLSLSSTAQAQFDEPFSSGAGFGNDPMLDDSESNTIASALVDAKTIKPGQTFTVALRLKHPPGYHSYYNNDGTGIVLHPEIDWTLPKGFTAGPLIYPTPHLGESIGSKAYMYSDEVFFTTQITAPADLEIGKSYPITGAASWQICKESCLREFYDIKLSLPAANASEPNPAYAQAVDEYSKHFIPTFQIPEDWKAKASETDGTITLNLTAGSPLPNDVEFYEFDAQINIQKPLTNTTSGNNFTFSGTRNQGNESKTPPKLPFIRGILHSRSMALVGDHHSVFISIPFANKFAPLKPASMKLIKAAEPTEETPDAGEPKTPDAAQAAEQKQSKHNQDSYLKIIPLDKITDSGDVLDDNGNVIPPDKLFMDDDGNIVNKEGKITSKKKNTTFLLAALLIFGGGLILNLMPCVFPVLGIKVLGFVQLAGNDPKKIRNHGLVFALGVIVSMWILAGIMLIIRENSGNAITWGSQMKDPRFIGIMIILLTLFALNLFGVFEIGTSLTSVGGNLQSKKGYEGSFFSGMLTTLIATPCGAPLLAGAMAYTLQQPIPVALILFTIFAMGVSAPYVVLAFLPKLIDKLPRPGAWMVTFKKAMALPLLATVVYLLGTYITQTGDYGTIVMLWALVIFTTAAFIYGTWSSPIIPKVKRYTIGYGLSLLVAIGAGYVAYNSIYSKPKIIGENSSIAENSSHNVHDWIPWRLGIVDEYRDKGNIIWVDYTANW